MMRWGRKDTDKGPTGDAFTWSVVGAPRPGTEASVAALDAGTSAGPVALATVDAAFDPDAFVEWSKTVYERARAAWRTRSPEPLRAVMDDSVWNGYAQHLLAVGTIPLLSSLMSAAVATAHLDGTATDASGQSALIGFAVSTDGAVLTSWGLDDDHRTWEERWLFQRPASARTHASGAVAVCPVCGAPAQPEETGRCMYCHADITTRTAGWLVTRTASSQNSTAKLDAKVASMHAEMREEVARSLPLPPPPAAGTPLQPPRADG
jgi:hypothetical protein